MAVRVIALIVLLAVALGLLVIGRWGRSHALDLVPTSLPAEDRDKKAAVVRRGGLVCYCGAAVMASAGVLAML